MYCYIYDEFVQDKRFEKELLLIENRLTDLGIAGKILRLALFRNAEEMIRDEVKRGITSVVVVGNDVTIRKVIDIIADSGVTFGLIPLGEDNLLAKVLGIPRGMAACDVLSARIVEQIDAGVVNGRRFITSLSAPQFRAEITFDDKFRMTPQTVGELEIYNLTDGTLPPEMLPDPRDGELDAYLKVNGRRGLFGRSKGGQSCVSSKQMTIKSESPMSVYVDGEEMKGSRFEISVEPKALKLVTGKARLF